MLSARPCNTALNGNFPVAQLRIVGRWEREESLASILSRPGFFGEE
jgi:hypothetical protein